jgi:ABC-type sugar transport system substrate-binding protein
MRVARYVGLLGAACLVATVFACGSGNGSSGSTTGSTGAKPKIALVEHVRVPAVEIFAYGATAASNELGFPLDITGPQGYNLQQQQAMSDAEANAGAKGIIEILVGATAWSRNETALMDRGIKVVNIGVYTGPFLDTKTPIYVGPNDIEYGRALGDLVVKAIGGMTAQGDVVIATCVPGLLEQEDRFNGVRLALSDYAPNVNLIGLLNVSDDPSIGIPQWQQIVQKYPNALAFVGLCSTHPADLAKVKASTPGAKWVITGGELDPGTLAGIKDGRIYGVVDAAIWQQGYIAAKLLYLQNTSSNIPQTGWIDPGIEVVTQSNIDAVTAREQGSRADQEKFYKPLMDKIFGNLAGNIKPLADAHR